VNCEFTEQRLHYRELETLYGDSAYQTHHKQLKSIAAISRFMKKAVPDDTDFEKEFSRTEVKQAAQARYFLRALERQFRDEPQPSFIPNDEGIITLEHILPKDFYEYRGEWKHINDEKHDVLTYRLGNQVLLTEKDNGAVGSRGYELKQPILAASEFSLTKQAGEYPKWDTDQVNDRQENLAKLAVKTWPVRLRY
jgi:hypothetical protein